MPLEDREYIEAALLRDAGDSGRAIETAEDMAEIERRAAAALSGSTPGYTLDEAISRASAAVVVTEGKSEREVCAYVYGRAVRLKKAGRHDQADTDESQDQDKDSDPSE